MGLGRVITKATTKSIPRSAMAEQTLYGRLLGKKLNGAGVAALIGGTMAVSTGRAVFDNGGSKFAKLGYTSIGENLDRLVSYDGSGFVKGANRIANGDPEIMQDIVDNTFTNINQMGASGDIVFALHNMREG